MLVSDRRISDGRAPWVWPSVTAVTHVKGSVKPVRAPPITAASPGWPAISLESVTQRWAAHFYAGSLLIHTVLWVWDFKKKWKFDVIWLKHFVKCTCPWFQQASKLRKISKKAQTPKNRDARQGEADRHIFDLKPKHLFAGKRKQGKTDRR